MSAVLNFDIAMDSHICGTCGITWQQPLEFTKQKRRDLSTFYCPNGHPWVFRESDIDKLRKEMQAQIDRKERERAWAAEARDRYHQEVEDTKRKLSAAKGQLTKTKKRVAGGICPCCNRSFVALARHMKTKHPDYTAQG